MSEQYTPTTAEVREVWEYHLSEGMASEAVKYDANWDTDRLLAQFDRWLAERDAEVAAKAYERGILDVGLNPDLANQLLDTNPYRKEVES